MLCLNVHRHRIVRETVQSSCPLCKEKGQVKKAGLRYTKPIVTAFRHARVISARFTYTPSNMTLFALSPLLQYTIPDNLGLFVASLSDSQLRNDPRLAGFNPQLARLQAAIAAMSSMIESDPKWFEKSHHRVRRVPVGVSTAAPRSLDSGIASLPSIQPLSLRNQETDSVASFPSPTGVVVAAAPLEEDARPLLEDDVEEVGYHPSSQFDAVTDVVLQMDIAGEKPAHDDTSGDSAFHSAVVVDEIPPECEVGSFAFLPLCNKPFPGSSKWPSFP